MLRLCGQECNISDFFHMIEEEEADCVFPEAISTFRAHKQFDAAIRLEMKFGPLMRRTTLKSKLSLALTYLEQYRLEFHQRAQMRKKDFSTMNSLIVPLLKEYPIKKNFCFEYCLVVAQWYYLTHTLLGHTETRNKLNDAASTWIAACLPISTPIEITPFRCLGEEKCYTCTQAVTPTEVQYVCSGCRVACYCSVDHQRMTWKQEAVDGMRIGHEILCPLYKAYRKYTNARDANDKEKELTMGRRLGRECRKFLEYGLGLKNKRFRSDEVDRECINYLEHGYDVAKALNSSSIQK
ncbi:predicted protein [Chaetoceros tenuissimus]|uniref:MYND-type domain-containing protein n=1 Tax=Chaetoceros tenuissimus TaxID=426638 RepID=A0AAD3HG00_9STRA|nr:predicted protein [Chaetoceros tenuissimus]